MQEEERGEEGAEHDRRSPADASGRGVQDSDAAKSHTGPWVVGTGGSAILGTHHQFFFPLRNRGAIPHPQTPPSPPTKCQIYLLLLPGENNLAGTRFTAPLDTVCCSQVMSHVLSGMSPRFPTYQPHVSRVVNLSHISGSHDRHLSGQ